MPRHHTRTTMSIGVKDRRVIADFLAGKPNHKGLKLDTDGFFLDGLWMGGRGIAQRTGSTSTRNGGIMFNDLGSRAAQTVQNATKRMMKRR